MGIERLSLTSGLEAYYDLRWPRLLCVRRRISIAGSRLGQPKEDHMRRKLLIPAVLILTVALAIMLTMTVLAGSGNPGGDDSLHPDHSGADDEANKIVGVPCATGSHHKHVGETNDPPNHIHHSTYYWYDSNEDEGSPPPERVVKIACGMAHDESTSITSFGDHGTVGWDDDTGKFTFTGNTRTGLGNYTSERVKYCNGLIDDGNAGAYPTFEGVPDLCNRFFVHVREAVRPASGGL